MDGDADGRDGSDADEQHSHRGTKEAAVSKAGDILSDLLYGLINAIVGIPTMISFAAIIFSVSPKVPDLFSRLKF